MNELLQGLGLPSRPKPVTQVSSGIRWLAVSNDWSIEDPWPYQASGPYGLDEAIDIFIDRNLRWMPMPRMQKRLSGELEANVETIWASLHELLQRLRPTQAVNEALERARSSTASLANVASGAACIYEHMTPLCSVLRDTRMQSPVIAIGVALLALDIAWCRSVDLKIIRTINSWSFPWQPDSFRSILRNCSPLHLVDLSDLRVDNAAMPIDAAFMVEFLRRVDQALQRRALDNAVRMLPVAPPEWFHFDTTMRMFDDKGLQDHVDSVLRDLSDTCGLRVSTLRSWAYIKDLAEEHPDIRFRPH